MDLSGAEGEKKPQETPTTPKATRKGVGPAFAPPFLCTHLLFRCLLDRLRCAALQRRGDDAQWSTTAGDERDEERCGKGTILGICPRWSFLPLGLEF